MTKPEPWCVKHRDGWCLVKTGMRPAEAATSIPTKCGGFVILPSGIEQRQPDCDECRASAGAPMTTLDDLIARLGAATGADRGLDALIAAHTGWDCWTIEEWEPFTRGEPGKDWAPEHPPVMDRCPAYTGSLDAAMMLVPEGWRWDSMERDVSWIEDDYSEQSFGVCVDQRDADDRWLKNELGSHDLLPIALTIAALKARKARP